MRRTSVDSAEMVRGVEELASWVLAQLRRLSDAVNVNAELGQTVLVVAPAKPIVGQLYYADGTQWNPGGGEGTYEYRSNGNFYKLGA